MINPSMVTGEVGRAVDLDRIRKAEAFRASRASRDDTGQTRGGRTSIVATASRLVARTFTSRSRTRRRAATTGC